MRTYVRRLWNCKEQGFLFDVHEDKRTRMARDPRDSKYWHRRLDLEEEKELEGQLGY